MTFYSPSLLVALLASSTLLHAQDSPLEKQMQILARGMKQISQQVTNPTKQQENIILAESLHKVALDSENMEPRKTGTVAEGDRTAFLEAYKAQIQKLADALSKVDQALKSGQYEAAKAELGKIQGIKKEGHSKFKQD